MSGPGLSLRDLKLYVNGAEISIGVLCGFLIGFLNMLGLSDPTAMGILFGFGSALCWGLGSIGAIDPLSNQANRFAALSAATSLGFLSPFSGVCAAGPGVLPPFVVQLCGVRDWHF